MRILVALGLFFAFAKPSIAAETLITILTAGPNGVYYPLGTTLASIYGKGIPGANVTVQATGGSVVNLRRLEAGEGELAFTIGDSLANAWRGNRAAGFAGPLEKLRGIARLYQNFIQIVASTESGIETLTDLKGKRVSVGPKGSGTTLNAAAIFKAAGFGFQDLGKVDYSPFGTAARAVKNGTLDATFVSAGLEVESVRHLLASGNARLVPIPADVVAKIGSSVYVAAVIPRGTYDAQTVDVATVTIPNFLATRQGVGNNLAYMMTKLLFEHSDQLVETHPAAKGIDIKTATEGMPVPLHPGAERYYREAGVLK
jgi:TRAP transporter TAXI family solute receptor